MDDGNSVTTKLLTLLNVSATKIGKRKRVDEFVHSETKLNKRVRPSVAFSNFTRDSEKEEGEKQNPHFLNEGDSAGEDEKVELDETKGTNQLPFFQD